ncbi:hypothetical protein HNQ02_001493 [Flavobacterium sp. 7E]|uniref:hypothetical protein n=1 Tax=Flavobacterium sp. 7E TaxID=2735898 RepID=UPI00156D6E25|nr:hypothetical protein [Flavobacterium sp. 7E]NRS88579.1 hypothetical protein [Flavobacterium sp. 7E]
MMTKKIFFCLIILSCTFSVVAQKEQKTVGDFDNDNLSDTLYYKDYRFVDLYRDKDISYICKIVRGNGKVFNFNLPLGYDAIQFFQCSKKGCIGTYQWKTGINGFETNETYIYKKEFDNWILEKSETIYNGGKKEVYKDEVPTGIDGREYEIEAKSEINNFSGIYMLKSCQDSRFKIEISKKLNEYYYLIFDKEKIISKDKVVMSKNDFTIGKIKGTFSYGNLQIKNYDTANPKLLHFTQCNEEQLTFIK